MSSDVSQTERPELGTPRGRRLLASAVLASGVIFLDSDAVTVALPDMARDLDAGITVMQWVLNLFLLVLGGFLLVGGSIGDRFGRRRTFLSGLSLFGLGTLLAASAPDVGLLLVARVVQGAGAALLSPVSLAIVSVGFAQEDRSAAIGWWSGLTALSAVVGPLLGGSLTTLWSWRGVFLAEAVCLALTFVVAVRHLHVPEPRRGGRIDLAGGVAAAAAAGGAAFALIQGRSWGFGSPAVLLAAAIAVAGIPALVAVEHHRRDRDPMLPLGLFRSRRFSVGNAVTAGVYFALSGVLFLVVVTLQEAHGYAPVSAGLAVLPVSGMLLALSPVAGRLVDRVGPRVMLVAGPGIVALGITLLATLTPTSYVRGFLPGLLVFGLGMAVTVAPLTSTVLAGVPEEHESTASGANSAIARTAGALAVAALPAVSGFTVDLAPAPLLAAYQQALVLSGVAAALAAVAALALPRVRDVEAG